MYDIVIYRNDWKYFHERRMSSMEFKNLVDELRSTTKTTEKLYWLDYYLNDPTDGPYLCYLMQEAFDPKRLHNVKMKKSDLPSPGKKSLGSQRESMRQLFELLADNHSSQGNKRRVQRVMEVLTTEDQEALMGVVNKKLRCGVGITQINKVISELIRVQKIQLAKKYEPERNYEERYWYVSPKLDGQRIFAIRNHLDGWKLYSRNDKYLGLEIHTLDHWKPELENLNQYTGITFADGEAYKHGFKFEQIQSLVGSDVNVKDTKGIKYHIFYMGKGSLETQELLGIPPNAIYKPFRSGGNGVNYQYLVGIRQEKIINNKEVIYEHLDRAVKDGYEGVILRADSKWYDFKRSISLIKVKKSDTEGTEIEVDCYVEDIEHGDFIVRENNCEEDEWLPVRLLVTINKCPTELDLPEDSRRRIFAKQMAVGSGFTLQDRRAWNDNPDLIVGKVIEVVCQGFGAKGRMRFPRYKRTREDL